MSNVVCSSTQGSTSSLFGDSRAASAASTYAMTLFTTDIWRGIASRVEMLQLAVAYDFRVSQLPALVNSRHLLGISNRAQTVEGQAQKQFICRFSDWKEFGIDNNNNTEALKVDSNHSCYLLCHARMQAILGICLLSTLGNGTCAAPLACKDSRRLQKWLDSYFKARFRT